MKILRGELEEIKRVIVERLGRDTRSFRAGHTGFGDGIPCVDFETTGEKLAEAVLARMVDVDLDEILADFIEAGCDGSRPNSFTKYLKGQLEVKHDAIE